MRVPLESAGAEGEVLGGAGVLRFCLNRIPRHPAPWGRPRAGRRVHFACAVALSQNAATCAFRHPAVRTPGQSAEGRVRTRSVHAGSRQPPGAKVYGFRRSVSRWTRHHFYELTACVMPRHPAPRARRLPRWEGASGNQLMSGHKDPDGRYFFGVTALLADHAP